MTSPLVRSPASMDVPAMLEEAKREHEQTKKPKCCVIQRTCKAALQAMKVFDIDKPNET